MKTVFIDFETFYDAKAKYSLKHTMQQYIRDRRFAVLGMSAAYEDGDVIWVEPDNIQGFFDNSDPEETLLVAHNASFDASVAYRVYGFKAKRYMCTMFMARYLISQGILPPETGTALKEIAPFAGVGDKGNLDEALITEKLDTYAIQDTEICRAFYGAYSRFVPEDEAMYIDMHVKASAIPQFALDTISLQEVAMVDENRKKWYTTVRNDAALISMLEARGVSVEYKDMKSGKKPCFSKSDDFMAYLLKHTDPVVRYLAALRLDAKSTCAVSKAQRFLDCGSPMACPLVYYAATTGRSGGTDSLNVQNMPRGSKVRTSLMAQPGKKLVIIDSSQIEVRTLGWLAKDESVLSVFRRGGDIYREFAGYHLYHKDPADVTKGERQIAKAAVLALGFGQGVQGFIAYAKRMGVEINEAEARHTVSTYRATFPKITGGTQFGGYWAEAEAFTLSHGYSVLPNGRKIIYPNLHRENGELVFTRPAIFSKGKHVLPSRLWFGLIIENATQATARDLIFSQVAEVLKKYPMVDLCLMVHDEAIFSVPEEIVDEVYQYADKCFRTPPAWANDIPVVGEGHISDRYDK